MRSSFRQTLALPILCGQLLFSLGACAQEGKTSPTDDEIRDVLTRASIAVYDGACPCPESRNAKGERCGGTSAYTKEQGGHRLLCSPSCLSSV